MKWLHISDIHQVDNAKAQGVATISLRDEFLVYLKKKEIRVDEIFITGDFRDASINHDNGSADAAAAVSAANYIRSIAKITGVTDYSHIHLVPGNHDVDRPKLRPQMLEVFAANYNANDGFFDAKSLKTILSDFGFYERVLRNLYNTPEYENHLSKPIEMLKNPHSLRECGDYNLLYLNTALFSDEKDEKLLVGNGYVQDLIKDLSNRVPTIILGHHGYHGIPFEEKKQLERHFHKCGAILYLCGHHHDNNSQFINETVRQFAASCIQYSDGVVPGFFTGELKPEQQSYTIKAHWWFNGTGRWADNTAFFEEGSEGTFFYGEKAALAKECRHDIPDEPAIIIKGHGNGERGKLLRKLKKERNLCIGRENEIESVFAILRQYRADDSNMAVQVSGTVGIGKSTICKACMHMYMLKYTRDRVVIIDIASYSSKNTDIKKEAVMYSVLNALGLARNDNLDIDIEQQLDAYFETLADGGGKCLIYFDDFDYYIAGDDDHGVQNWFFKLVRTDGVLVLFSGTLGVPNDNHRRTIPVGPLSDEAAEALFINNWYGRDHLTDDDKACIKELLRKTQKHTLAIILLAAQRHGSVRDLLRDWDADVQYIKMTGAGRHESLSTALHLSYRLIEQDKLAKEIWCVFQFINTRISDYLLAKCIFAQDDIRHSIATLTQNKTLESVNGQYDMLNPIREAIQWFINDKKLIDEIFIKVYGALDTLIGDAVKRPLENARHVVSNIESLIEFARYVIVRTGEGGEGSNSTLAEDMCYKLEPFFEYSPVSARELLRSFYLANKNGRFRLFLERCLGNLEVRLCNKEKAEEYYKDVICSYETGGKERGEPEKAEYAKACHSKGDFEMMGTGHQEAEKRFKKLLTLTNDRYIRADANRRLGDLRCISANKCLGDLKKKEYDKAAKYYNTAAGLFRDGDGGISALRGYADTCKSIGDMEYNQSYANVDAVREKYNEAIKIFNGIGDNLRLANTYKSLFVLYSRNNLDDADEYFNTALELHKHRGVNDVLGHAKLWQSKGAVEYSKKNFGTARGPFEEAKELFMKAKDEPRLADTYKNMGDLETDDGNYDKAYYNYNEARKIYERYREKDEWHGDIYKRLGDLEFKLGSKGSRLSKGQEYYGKAIGFYQRTDCRDKLDIACQCLKDLEDDSRGK